MKLLRKLVEALRLVRATIRDPQGVRSIAQVRQAGLSYLGAAALLDLYESVQQLERQQLPGILVEAGTALGGSALIMATAKQRARPLWLYDVFGQIPPPSSLDGEEALDRYAQIRTGQAEGIAGKSYYGYQQDLLAQVQTRFSERGFDLAQDHLCFVQGLYQETLQIQEPIALAHIDCDWYDSVKICLERITPHLVPGGRLVMDDYLYWPGCTMAVDEYFANRRHEFAFIMKARLHIVCLA
jgi:asparagine synthase (glutamine-hydrolysing)